jgi:hypothetical protein
MYSLEITMLNVLSFVMTIILEIEVLVFITDEVATTLLLTLASELYLPILI